MIISPFVFRHDLYFQYTRLRYYVHAETDANGFVTYIIMEEEKKHMSIRDL